MKDMFQDPQIRSFLDQFARDGLPAIAGSGMVISSIDSNPDPKLCLEIGAAVLLDKPIVICVPSGRIVPENLRKCAHSIITLGPGGELNEDAKGQIEDAIYQIVSSKGKPAQGS